MQVTWGCWDDVDEKTSEGEERLRECHAFWGKCSWSSNLLYFS